MSAKSDATAELLTKFLVHRLIDEDCSDTMVCGAMHPGPSVYNMPTCNRDVYVVYDHDSFVETHVLCPKCWEGWR